MKTLTGLSRAATVVAPRGLTALASHGSTAEDRTWASHRGERPGCGAPC